jgi:hypothetical protein
MADADDTTSLHEQLAAHLHALAARLGMTDAEDTTTP